MMSTEVETERRNRIRLSLAAYAYECMNKQVMTDSEFDALSYKINPSLETGNTLLDNFFKEKFSPDTGLWIYQHPEFEKLITLYERLYNDS